MSDLQVVALGLGLLGVMVTYVAAVLEFAQGLAVRRSKDVAFRTIVARESHFQNIHVPAVTAVISGLLVGISSSFFFTALTSDAPSWAGWAGIGFLVAATLSVALLLRMARGSGDEAEDLLGDPQAIRAAARECAEDPERAPFTVAELRSRLALWREGLENHALGHRSRRPRPTVRAALQDAAPLTGLATVPACLRVYGRMVGASPWRSCLPLLAAVLAVAGMTPVFLGLASRVDASVTQVLRAVLAAVIYLLLVIGGPALYGWMRGRRAVRWFRVLSESAADAEREIDAAQAAVSRRRAELANRRDRERARRSEVERWARDARALGVVNLGAVLSMSALVLVGMFSGRRGPWPR